MTDRNQITRAFCIFLGLLCCAITLYAEPIKITLWHSMAGQLNLVLQQIVTKFNHSQNQYRVIPIYKGNYNTALTAAAAAYRAHRQPDILQAAEMETAIMMHSNGAIIPLYQLQKMTHIKIAISPFPVIKAYYSTQNGQLSGLPFNTSSAVLYYNKRAFKQAGISHPPQTYKQLAQDSRRLMSKGFACGYTAAWPSWTLFEQYSAWHNLPFASEHNGFDSLNSVLLINNPKIQAYLTRLKSWNQQHIFQYGGQEDAAQSLFVSQHCTMLMTSSGSLTSLLENVPFPLGVAMLPYNQQDGNHPQNTIIGGAALWAFSGHSKAVYRGIAKFYAFLSKPSQQAYFAEKTGYLPISKQAYHIMQQSGYYRKYPGAKIALEELNLNPSTPYSRGIRLGNYPLVRLAIIAGLEKFLTAHITAKQALAEMTKHANKLIQRFARQNGAQYVDLS